MTTYQKRMKIPEPMREAPSIGGEYWVPNPEDPTDPVLTFWCNDRYDKALLEAGLCYRTKKDAIARAKAMLMTEEEE